MDVKAATLTTAVVVAGFTSGVIQRASNTIRWCFRDRDRVQQSSHLRQQEDILSELTENNAAAAEALRIAQDELLQAEMRLAVRERNLRVNTQEMSDIQQTRQVVDDEFRRAEAERQKVEERRRRAEEDVKRAVEEHARAVAEAKEAKRLQEAALDSLRDAELGATDALTEQEQAEHNLRQGIRPIVTPTEAECHAMKERLEYTESLFHVAIAGIAGSGKSSLANAFRGLRNSDRGAAPTGVVETTDTIARYPDPNPSRPFVWYDVPGAGTLSVSDWQYFTDQGLYIFDCIIVLFDTRLTATDIAILHNSARFEIPIYIVRSKALQHIRNVAIDMSGDDDNDGDNNTGMQVLERAREMYIRDTRASVSHNLDAAGLPQERAYLVDKDTLVKTVKDRPVKGGIDELDLLKDLLAEARRRRMSRN